MSNNAEQIAKELDSDGRKLLKELVDRLPNIKPNNPKTFVGYKSLHDALGLTQAGSTFGISLQNQGLSSLANWTYDNDLPAITGIIIDKDKLSPGQGYFELFSKTDTDWDWWFGEIAKAKSFDWSPYIASASSTGIAASNPGDEWREEELRASVQAYLDMQRKEHAQLPFKKSECYVELSKRFGRTPSSFEFRMQNISYVLSLMGKDWLKGLRPAKNVGKKVASQIEALVLELSQSTQPPVVSFEMEVRENLENKNLPEPAGSKQPATTTSQVVQYMRDPLVKAWVLKHAAGVCECCGQDAPFETTDGHPFLEVHHVRKLAEGGSDTTSNAVAICPNCHRALHYGMKAKELVEALYKNITRLNQE